MDLDQYCKKKKPIFLWFFRGRGGPPVPPLDPPKLDPFSLTRCILESYSDWKPLNVTFGETKKKSKINAAECDILSGSALLTKIKQSSGTEIHRYVKILT